MATKETIFNLTLSKLLLAREVTNATTDTSREVKILNTHWDSALRMTLKDLNLSTLAIEFDLELIESINNDGPYLYAYKYPTECVLLRRIVSGYAVDTRYTSILKKVTQYEGQKAILTSKVNAQAEIQSKNIPLSAIGPEAENALACQLGILAAPLLVGKGAKALKESLLQEYVIHKGEAQEGDMNENYNPEEEALESEFVAARLS